jgi:methionine sulfoxide reductase heme-binding subunit
MRTTDPAEYGWWLSSRAAGVIAFALISLSVLLGLAMANRLVKGPNVVKLHEHLALSGLVAIAVHAITLLGDSWLDPGPVGLLVPFAMDYRPLYSGIGVIAAYLAVFLGLSFYVRRRIHPRRWRNLHRYTVLVYVLGVIHVVGAGTDADAAWLRAILFATAAPITFLLLLRLLPNQSRGSGVRRPIS